MQNRGQASPRRRLRDGGVCLVAGCFPLYIKTPQRNWNSYIILCYLSGAGGLRRCGKGAKRSLLILAARSQALPFYSAVGTGVESTENCKTADRYIPIPPIICLKKLMILSMIFLIFALISANLVLRLARARSEFSFASSSGMSLPIMTGAQLSL